jgi:hypothetical protein
MTSRTASARKRKQTVEESEVVVSSDAQNKSKARRVSTDTSDSTAASLQVDTPVITESVTEAEASIESIGKMVQDLAHSDNDTVNAALADLDLHIKNGHEKKNGKIQTVGGCLALVQLLKKCLDKAIATIPACDEVTEVNEFDELWTLNKTLEVINGLTYEHDESLVGITAIGGVEVAVKIMNTFPKCADLQLRACVAVINLATCNIGKARIIESGGIEALLATVTNHLNSENMCGNTCWALSNIVDGSKENAGLLISLGGGAAVEKVRRKWPDNIDVQSHVKVLANTFAAEWKARADE